MAYYNFFPTLLNDFRNYQLEKVYGNSSFILCEEQKLIDKLNRKPYAPSEAMLKGIAFEQLLQQPSGYVHNGFEFDIDVVDEMRAYCAGGIWQTFVEFTIDVDGHKVRLYGYIDVVKQVRTIDVKTGAQYEFPGFDDYFQHHVYLLGCRNADIRVTEHVYLITDFTQVYKEPYDLNEKKMVEDLQKVCRELIHFTEMKRDLITNEKLFAKHG